MKNQRDLPLNEGRPRVRVYAVINLDQGYQEVANGVLELVTDTYENHSQHYIEVKQFTSQSVLLRSRLLLRNNYEIQKDSVICWVDSAHQYQDLGISFESQQECDIYWRLICSKIGKNYLQINGSEKLDMPNQNNLAYIMGKVKNSFKMISYHIINDNEFLNCLTQVFNIMQIKKDQMGIGMIVRIMKIIISTHDNKVLDSLLGDRHFSFFLRIQQCTSNHYVDQYNIDFTSLYENTAKRRILIDFPKDIAQKINIVHRAAFCKQCIIDLSKQSRLENMLQIVIKQNYSQIISYLLHQNILQQISQLTLNKFKQFLLKNSHRQHIQDKKCKSNIDIQINNLQEINKKQSKNNQQLQQKQKQIDKYNNISQNFLQNWKIQFLIQSLAIIRQIHGDRTKKNFYNRVYQSGLMKTLQYLLDQGYYKSLQVLSQIAAFQPQKFLDYLRDGFRQSPNINLHRKLAKKFCYGGSDFQQGIMQLLKSFIVQLKQRRDFLDFYSGTFVCFIFQHCKNSEALLSIVLLFLENISNSMSVYNLIIKYKIFQKISSDCSFNKKTQCLHIGKLLRNLLISQKQATLLQSQSYIIQINRIKNYIIQSGLLDISIKILIKFISHNNTISSSMLQNIKLIEKQGYSIFTQFIKDKYSQQMCLLPYIDKIIKFKQINQQYTQNFEFTDNHHKIILQLQKQQQYLLANQQQENNQQNNKYHIIQNQLSNDIDKKRKQIENMTDQIRKRSKYNQFQNIDITKKKIKKQVQQDNGFIIQFDPLDEI